MALAFGDGGGEGGVGGEGGGDGLADVAVDGAEAFEGGGVGADETAGRIDDEDGVWDVEEEGVGGDGEQFKETTADDGPREQETADGEAHGRVVEFGTRAETHHVGDAGEPRGEGGQDDDPGLLAEDVADADDVGGQHDGTGEHEAVAVEDGGPEHGAAPVVGEDGGAALDGGDLGPVESVPGVGESGQQHDAAERNDQRRQGAARAGAVVGVGVGEVEKGDRPHHDADVGNLGPKDFRGQGDGGEFQGAGKRPEDRAAENGEQPGGAGGDAPQRPDEGGGHQAKTRGYRLRQGERGDLKCEEVTHGCGQLCRAVRGGTSG